MPSRPCAHVFNGDADGILAQHLMALAEGAPELRVTGWKRDIALLGKVPAAFSGDVKVFDIGLDANREALETRLALGEGSVRWFDHHESDPPPEHARFTAILRTAPEVCTAVIVLGALPGSDVRWAAAAAYGDAMPSTAEKLLRPLGATPALAARLRRMGEMINYNAYAAKPEAALLSPLALAEALAPFADPLEFLDGCDIVDALSARYAEDRRHAEGLHPYRTGPGAEIYVLPEADWAARMGAMLANAWSEAGPDKALAVLNAEEEGYRVSLRSPRIGPAQGRSAGALAREFPGGGGRARSAGILRLPEAERAEFCRRFLEYFAT